MKRIYLMAAVAIIVIVAVVSQIRAAEALSPGNLGWRQGLGAAAAALSRYIRRIVDDCTAAIIANRERQAKLSALGKLSDAELKDFGVCRGGRVSAFYRHRNTAFTATR